MNPLLYLRFMRKTRYTNTVWWYEIGNKLVGNILTPFFTEYVFSMQKCTVEICLFETLQLIFVEWGLTNRERLALSCSQTILAVRQNRTYERTKWLLNYWRMFLYWMKKCILCKDKISTIIQMHVYFGRTSSKYNSTNPM